MSQGGKKHNIQCLFLSGWTMPRACVQLELWEGLELHFEGSLGSVECSTPSPAPVTPLWAVTCWKLLPAADSFEHRTPSSWKKRALPMFCCFGFMPCTSLPTLWNRESVLLVAFSGYPQTAELFCFYIHFFQLTNIYFSKFFTFIFTRYIFYFWKGTKIVFKSLWFIIKYLWTEIHIIKTKLCIKWASPIQMHLLE